MPLLWVQFVLNGEGVQGEVTQPRPCFWIAPLPGLLVLAVLCVPELYLSCRNCGHVNPCSDLNMSVNMFLSHDVHACYFAIIYSFIYFIFCPLSK